MLCLRVFAFVRLISIVAVFIAVPAVAQEFDNKSNIGLPPNGVFDGSSFDNIQVNNGNLHIEIPITSYPGRGVTAPVKYVYDNKGWTIDTFCNAHGFCADHVASEPGSNMILNIANPFKYTGSTKTIHQQCTPGITEIARTGRVLREPNGTKHHLLPDPAIAGGNSCWGDLNGPAYTEDGSGLVIINGATYRKDGTRVGADFLEDTNGNQILPGSGGFTDTLGRTIPLDGTYFDSSGTQRQIQVITTSVAISTQLCWFGNGDTCDEKIATWTVPGQIIFPNGMTYTFTYVQNQYGEPSSVTLPTGGQISWTWNTTPDSAGRRVTSRTVTENGQSATTSYNGGVVTDPLGNETTYTFAGIKSGFRDWSVGENTDPPKYQTDVRQYQGTAASGTLLTTVHTDYTGQTGSSRPGTILPIRVTTTWAQANLVKKTETAYDILSVWSGNVTWTNVKSTTEYDWGVGSPGALLRITARSYLHELNGNYRNVNIADRVVDETVMDGLGNTVANTHTDYDDQNHMVASLSGAPNHNSSKGTGFFLRGNPTRVNHWLNTTGASLTTDNFYDDLGNLRTTTDPLGHSTQFSYSDAWWSNTACVPAGFNSQAYVTQTTNTLNQSSTAQYYPCTGQLGHSRDPNDIANNRDGTKRTYDLMNRVFQIDYPDGGQKLLAYHDTPNEAWVRQDTLLKANGSGNPGTCVGDKWASSYTQFDGLGRVKRTAKCNGLPVGSSHSDQVDTCYDLMGRKSFVSYPFQGPGFTPESYLCSNSQRPGDTFTYDALSRLRQVTNTDGGIVDTTFFSGHVKTVTDQAGKKRMLQEDGIGRLIFIEEPDAAGNLVNWTRYFYDPIGNLTRVEQQGADHVNQTNWRIRTFQYDSLSRLTSTSNPESGTITFTYDNDGNVLTKTAPRPNQTGALQVTTNFGYDQLHRLIWKTYSNNNESQHFVYDQANPWTFSVTNPIGRRVLAYHEVAPSTGPYFATVASYDPMGRPSFEQQGMTGAPYQRFDYAYNLDGSLKSLAYPSGRKLDYTYNIAQRATSMVDSASGNNYATDATYKAWGALASMKNGVTPSFAGITTSNDFNSRMQPLFLSAAKPGGSIMSLNYDFHLGAGNNGNVFQITNNRENNRTQIFTYDELNRISTAKTQATTGQYCWGESFGYDIWANLTSRGVLSGYAGCTGEADVPAATLKNQMATHTYDAAGNWLPVNYSYNAENQLVAASGGVTFDYDADGRRTKKATGSTGTLYWYGTSGEVLQETDLAGVLKREFVYFNGKRVARRDDGTFQSSATIQNALLSQANPLDQPPCFCFNYGPIPGWTSTGAQTGSFQPTTASYVAPLPGIVAYSNGGTISQTLATGLQANTTYTLLVDVGRRLEAGGTADYSLTLQAGSTVLATMRTSNATIPAGYFLTQALTYTAGSAPPAGNLTIVLESYGMQVNFKNVRLNLSSVGPVHYYFSDHLASSKVVTSPTGTIEEESDFYPFGGERLITDTLPDQNYKFTGKERDYETNLDYFGARYYAFNFGRFTTPDEFAGGPVDAFSSGDPLPPGPLPYADITNPQSLNKYTYAYNNPLRFTDPNGHDAWDLIAGIGNAMGSNASFGAGRMQGGNSDFKIGQKIGDAVSVVGGAIEMLAGATTSAGGAAACGTGVGCLVGAPAVAGGATIAAHGATEAGLGLRNLFASSSGGNQGGEVYVTEPQESGKPYVGRTTQGTDKRMATRTDGRSGKAKVVDTFDAKNKAQGRYKEQQVIDQQGGVKNLDNKRNEVAPQNMEKVKQEAEKP